MNRLSFFILALSCPALLLVFPGQSVASPPEGYELTFSDDFTNGLDPEVWQIDPARPNVEVVDGTLQLVTEELPGGGWRAGKLATTAFRQRFGYYEARFKIGAETGLNNAFWLNTPAPYAVAANTYDRFEIDIQEAHYPSTLRFNVHNWAPVHYGLGSRAVVVSEDLSVDYNTYGLEWTHDNTLRFYFNGELMHTVSGATVRDAGSTIPLELLFSTRVMSWAGQPGPNLDGSRMIIDEVRVYDRPGFLGSISGNFGSDANWASGRYPRINDAAVYNRPVATSTVTVAGISKDAREIYFDHPDLPGFTFIPRSDFPDAVLRLGSGGAAGITLNNTVPTAQVFDIPIVALERLALSNFSTKPGALLDLRGPIAAETPGVGVLFINDGPVLAQGRLESSIGSVDKYGDGKVILAAANQHAGVTRVARGSLVVAADGALGSTGEGTKVVAGGTLSLDGVNYSLPEPLSLAGAGLSGSAGALEARSGQASGFAGPVTLAAHATVGAQDPDGSLLLSGPVGAENSGMDLSLAGAGLTEVIGAISTVRHLFVRGPGVAKLSNPANTFGSGATVYVVAGTLLVAADSPHNAPGALGASSWRVRVGSPQSEPTDNAALLTVGPRMIGRPLQIEPTNSQGVSKIGGSTPDVSTFLGSIYLGRELTVESVEGGEVILSGALLDLNASGSIRKTGAGAARLTASNSYTGATTVKEGLLRIDEASSLPSSTTLIIKPGGVFDLAGHNRGIAGFVLDGGRLIDSTGSASTFLSLVGGAPFELRSGEVATRLGGTGGAVKTTDGQVILAGGHTFQGPIAIEDGTLTFDGSTSASASVSVNGGWLSGRGVIGAGVTVGGAGGLAFCLDAPASAHQPLSVNGSLAFAPEARVQLTMGEGAEPGAYVLVNAAGGLTGSLPDLDLPPGWTGQLRENGSGLLEVTLEQEELSGIAAWRVLHFGDGEAIGEAADDADPDGDGLNNMLEYALGGNPLAADPSILPRLNSESGRVALTFSRVADPKLEYIVEARDDLGAAVEWQTIWTSSGEANTEGEVTVQDTLFIGERTSRFFRLRVRYLYESGEATN